MSNSEMTCIIYCSKCNKPNKVLFDKGAKEINFKCRACQGNSYCHGSNLEQAEDREIDIYDVMLKELRDKQEKQKLLSELSVIEKFKIAHDVITFVNNYATK